jgi:dTDP-4-amino-4,6-dideoxygalactose transaminase
MIKFGFAAVVASGLAAAILGLAAPAPAQADTAVKTPVSVASAINIPTDFGHHAWVVDIQPRANVPHR